MEVEEEDLGFGECPKCGSTKYINVARGEHCLNCGYFESYS